MKSIMFLAMFLPTVALAHLTHGQYCTQVSIAAAGEARYLSYNQPAKSALKSIMCTTHGLTSETAVNIVNTSMSTRSSSSPPFNPQEA